MLASVLGAALDLPLTGSELLGLPTSVTAASRDVPTLAVRIDQLERKVDALLTGSASVDDDEYRSIPRIGRIGAGPGSDNDHVVVRRPKWLKRFPKNLRAAEVVGDCLTPDVLAGDMAVIDLDGSWGPKSIIAVRSDDGVQLKRFVRHEPGEEDEPGRLVLTSNDGEFALSDDDADIVGVFVCAQRTITVR
jgi:hypothetical protein